MMPKVSVVMTVYNHERYVRSAIESILNQTFSDFELIIINDGSVDKSEEIIRSFNDPRIVYHYQENSGPSMAANAGVSLAKSNYIAMMCGDDIAYQDRLKIQYEYMLQHPEATLVFGRLDVIDDQGRVLPRHFLRFRFNHFVYPGRYEMFKYLFFKNNTFNAVTAMLRKDIYLQLSGCCVSSIQLQDYLLWLEWLKKYDIVLLDEKLLYYRVRASNKNLSHVVNMNRIFFERLLILENILNDIDMDFFRQVFKEDLVDPDFTGLQAFELEKAFIYANHPIREMRDIGLRKLFYLLQDPKVLDIYLHHYHKSLADYYVATSKVSLSCAMKFKVFLKRIVNFPLAWFVLRPLYMIIIKCVRKNNI